MDSLLIIKNSKGKQNGNIIRISNDDVYCIFEYDTNGRRIRKKNDEHGYTYIYDGSKLMSIIFEDDDATMTFRYSLDKLIGFNYNGSEYIYGRNIQGDITHIYDSYGNVICKYHYDAWGNHKVLLPSGTIDTNASSIGNINPFRYRGYYYDVETQLFYCNSRYYSPELCRFIGLGNN